MVRLIENTKGEDWILAFYAYCRKELTKYELNRRFVSLEFGGLPIEVVGVFLVPFRDSTVMTPRVEPSLRFFFGADASKAAKLSDISRTDLPATKNRRP